MIEKRIVEEVKQLLQNGMDIIEQQKMLPHVYDVPVIDNVNVDQLNAVYKEWRKEYEIVIQEIEDRGVVLPLTRISIDSEQKAIFLYVPDINDQYRNIINALNMHIDELEKILEIIDYVEIDILEQLEGYKRLYGDDDRKACVELENDILRLLQGNPSKRHVLDIRKVNIGDSDLLDSICRILVAPESINRILLELNSLMDVNVLNNYLYKQYAQRITRVDVTSREIEPPIIMTME